MASEPSVKREVPLSGPLPSAEVYDAKALAAWLDRFTEDIYHDPENYVKLSACVRLLTDLSKEAPHDPR